MLPAERRQALLRTLHARGGVSITEAAGDLGVSEPTMRRDINLLVARGLAVRVHGGATLDPGGRTRTSERDRRPWTPYTVGLVVPSLRYYWPSIVRGARTAADDVGLRLLLRGSTYEVTDQRKQVEQLLERNPKLDGLIIGPNVNTAGADRILSWLDSLPIPVVLAERQPEGLGATRHLEWVISDHAAGAAHAVRYLSECGHVRLGLVARQNNPTTPHILRGWDLSIDAAGLSAADQLVVVNDDQLIGWERGHDFAELLAQCRRLGVTALLVHPESVALALVQYCANVGVRIPEDLALVSYDDEAASLGDPPLTAVRPPKEHIGRLAVESLLARLVERGRRPPVQIAVRPELIIRQST